MVPVRELEAGIEHERTIWATLKSNVLAKPLA